MKDDLIKVLVIEDNPGDSRLIRESLIHARETSFKIISAATLWAALQALGRNAGGELAEPASSSAENNRIDLILLDLNLPDSTGLETFLKINFRAPGLPIIILTGMDDEELALKAMQKGAQDYIIKDKLDSGLLVRAIRYAIERKRAEGKLKKAADEWAKTFDSIPDLIFLIDRQFKILRVNQATTKILGLSSQEILGQQCFRLIHGNDRPPLYCRHLQALEQSRENTFEIYEPKLVRHFLVSINPVSADSGGLNGTVHIMRDITDRKKMEEEILKREKLESVGVLAGGIAHDFNNILTAILGHISLAKNALDPEGEIAGDLTDAEKACRRATDLTRQLLTFSRGGAPIKKITSIADLIKDSATFVLAGTNSGVEFSFPKDLWPAEVDEGQISQVIQNLVINAYQAMPQGGIIKVGAENLEAPDLLHLPLMPGKYVKIFVKDQGVGISASLLKKIFDPFFTTKEKGNGLGLAVCYSIIQKHNGSIDVKSEPGTGTAFYIYLPASEKKISAQEEIELKPVKGTGKVLVMDDDENIREIAGRILKMLGYEVTFAREGNEALELCRQARKSEKPFDAVIMDLTVPGGMGGQEAIQKLREIDPEIRAVASSGYSDHPVMTEYKNYGFCDAIGKPYEIKGLSRTLARVIKGKEGIRN